MACWPCAEGILDSSNQDLNQGPVASLSVVPPRNEYVKVAAPYRDNGPYLVPILLVWKVWCLLSVSEGI